VAVGSGVAVGAGVGSTVAVLEGSGVGTGVTVAVGSGVEPPIGVGAGPGAPTVGDGVAVGSEVAVGSAVAKMSTVGTGTTKGVGVGVVIGLKGLGVGIGAKMSGEIVGGALPSAGPVQAAAAAVTISAPATANRLANSFMSDLPSHRDWVHRLAGHGHGTPLKGSPSICDLVKRYSVFHARRVDTGQETGVFSG